MVWGCRGLQTLILYGDKGGEVRFPGRQPGSRILAAPPRLPLPPRPRAVPGPPARTGPRALTRVRASARNRARPPRRPGSPPAARDLPTPPPLARRGPGEMPPRNPRAAAGLAAQEEKPLSAPGHAEPHLDPRSGTQPRPASQCACALASAPPPPRRGLHDNRPGAGSCAGSADGPGEPDGNATPSLPAASGLRTLRSPVQARPFLPPPAQRGPGVRASGQASPAAAGSPAAGFSRRDSWRRRRSGGRKEEWP